MSYVFSSIQNKHYFWGGFQANKESAMRTWIAPRLELALAPLKKKTRQITPVLEQGYIHTHSRPQCHSA